MDINNLKKKLNELNHSIEKSNKESLNIFNGEELYELFKENNQEYIYEHYDVINSNNAHKYLKIDNNGKIVIDWPKNNGFVLNTIKSIKDLEDNVLCSRIEIENLPCEELGTDITGKPFKGESTKEFFKYFANLRDIRLNGIDKNSKYYTDFFNERKNIGNCIGLKLEEKINSNSKEQDYNVCIDEEKLKKVLNRTDLQSASSRFEYYKKYNGKWDSNEKRGIPKKTLDSVLRCGTFCTKTYIKLVDILDSDLDNNKKQDEVFKLPGRIAGLMAKQSFNIINEEYKIYKNNRVALNGVDPKYGYFGKVDKFGDLCGGAYQMNAIFDFESLCNLDIIFFDEKFYNTGNVFESHEINYFSSN